MRAGFGTHIVPPGHTPRSFTSLYVCAMLQCQQHVGARHVTHLDSGMPWRSTNAHRMYVATTGMQQNPRNVFKRQTGQFMVSQWP